MKAMTRILVSTAIVAGLAGGAPPAFAASPDPSASCAAQLSQGGTPQGISKAPAGFLGRFVSGEATSGPGVVGVGSSTAAKQHGDLFACLPEGAG